MTRLPFSPRAWDLPFDRWRPDQKAAMRDVAGATTRFVVVNAPCGFGKSALAGGLAKVDDITRNVVLTSTKALQAQYERELTFLFDIRGMSNYPCLAARDEFKDVFRARHERGETVMCDDGPCRADVPCSLRTGGCAYFDRHRAALLSRTVLTNYSYWLSMRRYSKGLGQVDRLICDEGHAVAEELMSACRIDLPRSEMDARTTPREIQGWRRWAAAKLQDLEHKGDLAVMRRKHQHRVRRLEDLTRLEDHWAWEATERGYAFEPVIPRLLMGLLCDDTQKQVVMMSATITPALLSVLGVPEDQITFLQYPSTFPVANRPVYYFERSPRVDYRMTDSDKAYWLHLMDEWIKPRRETNGIIHSVSYDRADWIAGQSRHRSLMMVRRKGEPTSEFVGRFRLAGTKRPTVMVHPAVETGFDFPGDQARWQIIPKVPFASTRSPIAKRKIAENPEYRNQTAMQRVVQAVGRIVRSEDDWGETAIVDAHWTWFVRQAGQYAPEWFHEAVQTVRMVPRPLQGAVTA